MGFERQSRGPSGAALPKAAPAAAPVLDRTQPSAPDAALDASAADDFDASVDSSEQQTVRVPALADSLPGLPSAAGLPEPVFVPEAKASTRTPVVGPPTPDRLGARGRPLLDMKWVPDLSSWQEGAVIAGRYRLLEAIGTGGMGDVLLADDLLLQRKVAVKTLRRNLLENPLALERFRQEVAMAHAVSHLGLARTFDMGEAGGVFFLTMEYLTGETLADRLRREGPLPVAEVRRIGLEVAAALDAAHQAGVVHRDLKPSNIMLTPDRGAVVMDFGLAAAISDRRGLPGHEGLSELVRPTAKSAGTPNYMAPEQWKGEPQGAATDVYSFGCILFEALTGRLPFLAQTRTTMMQAHLTEKPPAIRTLRPGVPASLDHLVAACLSKEPGDRPPSMLAIARSLLVRRKRELAVTALLAVGVIGLLLGAASVVWSSTSLLLIRELRPSVKRLAMLVARDIDGADLDKIRKPADITRPEFKRVWQVIDRARRENPDVSYIYTMRKLKPEVMWEFVVDADPQDEDRNGDGIVDDDERGTPPGLKYDASGLTWLRLAFLENRPHADDSFTSDPWGLLLSGYAPIHGPGDDFYLVGVDVTDKPLMILRNTLYGVFLLLGLISAVLVVVLRQRRAMLVTGFGRAGVTKV
ncbi:MAG: serine/threonine-protein kinase [Myxococcota bacterium]|jgi:serine/threonine protein kinase|nr:serine/threonine-protein kinase [Myxococcota bacterium]